MIKIPGNGADKRAKILKVQWQWTMSLARALAYCPHEVDVLE